MLARLDGEEGPCFYCQKMCRKRDLIAEHYKPRCRGGADTRENLVLSCRPCDKEKGPLTGDEYIAVRHDPALLKKQVAEMHAILQSRPQKAKPGSSIIPGLRPRRLHQEIGPLVDDRGRIFMPYD